MGATTTVTLVMHLECADDQFTWWAETDAVQGFSAVAETLQELRNRISAALDEILGPGTYEVRERLASQTDYTVGQSVVEAQPRELMTA